MIKTAHIDIFYGLNGITCSQCNKVLVVSRRGKFTVVKNNFFKIDEETWIVEIKCNKCGTQNKYSIN